MRILKMLICTLPLAWAFAGCSEDSVVPDVGQGTDVPEGMHEVEVTFNMGVGASLELNSRSATTRAGEEYKDFTFIPNSGSAYNPANPAPPRELESSNNWQQVNDVRIYVFKKDDNSDKFLYYKPLDASGTPQNYYQVESFADKFSLSQNVFWWGGTGDVKEQHTYAIKPMLDEGEYKFLVVARDDKDMDVKILTDPNIDDDITSLSAWEEGKTELETATLVGTNGTEICATELFSGCTSESITVSENSKGFSREVELKRAVAGILCYVENIPAKLVATETFKVNRYQVTEGKEYNVSGIEIIPAIASDRVKLFDRTANGIDENLKNTNANRFTNRFFYADIPETAEVKDGYYINTAPNNERHPNSLLAGTFVMPHLPNTESMGQNDDTKADYLYKSLYLVFYTSDVANMDKTPLKWVPIKMIYSNGTPVESTEEAQYYFPIMANHFYSLGTKKYSEDGTTIENPDVNDKPIDLSKPEEGGDYNLVITVNPDWDWKGELEWAD